MSYFTSNEWDKKSMELQGNETVDAGTTRLLSRWIGINANINTEGGKRDREREREK